MIKKILKSELQQNKVDLKLSKEAEIKKMQDVFDEVKQEEQLKDIESFFIGDNDIFNNDEISEADRGFIMDLIGRTTFIANKKSLSRIRRWQKWELLINLLNKNYKKGSTF